MWESSVSMAEGCQTMSPWRWQQALPEPGKPCLAGEFLIRGHANLKFARERECVQENKSRNQNDEPGDERASLEKNLREGSWNRKQPRLLFGDGTPGRHTKVQRERPS